jgi:phosphoribosyl-ATP pyrophosphohydrolase
MPRPMATPRRVYRIYAEIRAHAAEIREFLSAKGEKSGTLDLLAAGDPAKPLKRFGEEMQELCGVLDGTHEDSYLMESTQTFYWASLFSTLRGASWEQLRFDENRRLAATCGIATVDELRASTQRLCELPPAQAKPEKLYLLWNVADRIYRLKTPAEQQWSLEQLMEADLQEMKKKAYLAPVIERVAD